MIKYLKYSEFDKYDDLLNLWNQNMNKIHQLNKLVFEEILIYDRDIDFNLSYVTYDNEILIGCIISKTYRDFGIYPMKKYNNVLTIDMILVDKKYRNQGIGSKLLSLVTDNIYKNIDVIKVGGSIQTLGPGVFDKNTHEWFLKHDFIDSGFSYDLIRTYEVKSYIELPALPINYKIKVCEKSELPSLLDFLNNSFHGGWHYALLASLLRTNRFDDYVILKNDLDDIIGFAKISDINSRPIQVDHVWSTYFKDLYGVGPLGIKKENRGQGFGYILVAYAINEQVRRGAKNILITWTGITDFYEKFGFKIFDTKYTCKKILK